MLRSALFLSYCTWRAAVLALPPSRVCNNSGGTRKRIIVSTRTRLRHCWACVPCSLSPRVGAGGGWATVKIQLLLPEKKDRKRLRKQEENERRRAREVGEKVLPSEEG